MNTQLDVQVDDLSDGANIVDISMEAALELAEMAQGERDSAPALTDFFNMLRAPRKGYAERPGISMLADFRTFPILKESLGQVAPSRLKSTQLDQLQLLVGDLLRDIEEGVQNKDRETVDLAKRFCLVFNSSLLARELADIYARRERSDARYIIHESLP